MFKTEVKGRYTLIRRKADGTPVETLEFDNIITNAGLDWIAAMDTDLMGEPVAVSTSTADPNPSAPAIPEVVQRTSVSAPGGGTTSGLDGEWLFWRKRWRFPQGTLAGQVLATVGLICNSDRRFESNTGELIPKDTPLSYTRIKDAAGQPTTLVVAADEILDVQYEFRSRPVGTAEAKFVISGVERTFRLIPQPFANRANSPGNATSSTTPTPISTARTHPAAMSAMGSGRRSTLSTFVVLTRHRSLCWPRSRTATWLGASPAPRNSRFTMDVTMCSISTRLL
ncbi:hypothetical protein FBPa18_0060 [Pseudomonas phage vB_PaeP_FBPa18]|nr:hypothetical protein FBPa18_0060 [Pseudomonas phage vB_PaeP_FBPa18]